MGIEPQIEGGLVAVKAIPDEDFTVSAQILAEPDLFVRAVVVLCDPDGVDRPTFPMHRRDEDRWAATVRADAVGAWTFRVVTWHDPLAAWVRDAHRRLTAGVEVELTMAEGATLLRRAQGRDAERLAVAKVLDDTSASAAARWSTAERLLNSPAPPVLRELLGESDDFPVFVDPERAMVGSWYELFPRSEGSVRDVGTQGRHSDAVIEPGTLATASKRLEAIAGMGFDVVCLPPVNPIGEIGRRGRNGSVAARPSDPGSPWAVGSRQGGHDTVHPDLGTTDDLAAFVTHAADLGMDVALTLSMSCAPDHPWVTSHPEWFRRHSDGSVARVETSAQVREDLCVLDFDADPDGLRDEVRRIIARWRGLGIRIFRVDHPGPLQFWERLLADLRHSDPAAVFVLGTFAHRALRRAYGAIGFHQSYSDLIRLERPADITAHLHAASHVTSDIVRPQFTVNTPHLLPRYLHGGDAALAKSRIVLAAAGSPTWGMYAGFENLEHEPLTPGSTDHLHAEKYEIKVRDWTDSPLAPFITGVNEVRRAHPALQRLRNLTVHRTSDSGVIAFSKTTGDDVVVVIIDLFPSFAKTVAIEVGPYALGRREAATLELLDPQDGTTCTLAEIPLSEDTPARILVPVGQ